MITNILFFLLFIAFGVCVGRIFTTIAYQLQKKEKIDLKNFYCSKCGVKLTIKSLIPILSFIIQKGKCLNCNEKINPRCFIAELINLFIYTLIFFKFSFGFYSLYFGLLFSLILTIIMIDFEYYEITIQSILLLVIFAIIYVIFSPTDPIFLLFSSVVYYGTTEILRIIMENIKNKKVLGDNDAKLMANCGIFLSIKNFGIFLFISGITGIIFYICWKKFKKEEIFPFAPIILISMYLILIFK